MAQGFRARVCRVPRAGRGLQAALTDQYASKARDRGWLAHVRRLCAVVALDGASVRNAAFSPRAPACRFDQALHVRMQAAHGDTHVDSPASAFVRMSAAGTVWVLQAPEQPCTLNA